jgi:hypothetical protein
VPNRKIASFQTFDKDAGRGLGNLHHVYDPRVGNLRGVLQVRYCTAALIIDERMQI